MGGRQVTESREAESNARPPETSPLERLAYRRSDPARHHLELGLAVCGLAEAILAGRLRRPAHRRVLGSRAGPAKELSGFQWQALSSMSATIAARSTICSI